MKDDWKTGKAEGEMKAWEEKRMAEVKKEFKKKQEEPLLKDIVAGLLVIDPSTYNEESSTVEIVHFCGYWDEVTQDDIDSLRKELAEDEEFGVTDIVDRLEIIECPDEMLDHYRKSGADE